MTQQFEDARLTLLPYWDLSVPDYPPRSRLYNLTPLGLHSPFVESLTSYLCRLAREHNVQVGTLIQYGIAPILGKQYIANDKSRSISSFLRYAGPINGNGIIASYWVSALESLTLRTDLAMLTLLVGANALSQRDLLQPVRQWCPMCYDVWRRQDDIIYEPLLWSINGITVCPEHCQPLKRCCQYCSSSLPWLTWCSRPGYCSVCGRWLGKASGNNQIEEKDRYIAETVGGFLTHIPQLSPLIHREGVINSLRVLIAAITEGNMAAFSRNLGLPKTTLWELVRGYFPPSLQFLLRLCFQFRLSLMQLLIGLENIAPGDTSSSKQQGDKQNSGRIFDHESAQRALEDILADRQGASLSMREIARCLGYPVRTINTHFPVHCREIARRHAEYRKQQAQLRKTYLRRRINEAARRVLTQGDNLTYRKVGAVLEAPGCFREEEARRALFDIRHQSAAEADT